MTALCIILSIILFIYILLRCSIVVNVNLTPEEKDIKVKYLFFNIYPSKEKVISEKKKQKLKNKRDKKRKKIAKKLQKEKLKLSKKKDKLNKKNSNSNVKSTLTPDMISHKMTDKKIQPSVNEIQNSANNKEEFSQTKPNEENIKEKKEKKEKIPLKDRISEYTDKWHKIKPFIPTGLKAVKRIIKSIRIDDINLYYLVTDEDAYECAMKYGKINMVVSNALGLLSALITISIDKINIATKFNSTETDYKLTCKIKTRPSTILAIAIACLVKMVYVYVKQQSLNKKGDAVNE